MPRSACYLQGRRRCHRAAWFASSDRSYTYDALGNRLVMNNAAAGTRTTSTYNGANRLVYSQDSTGRTTYTYDTDGQLRIQQAPAGARTTTVWDANDVMRSVRLPAGGGIVTYTYNADKLRVQKDAGAVTRNYIHDGQNLLTEFDGSVNQVTAFTVEPQEYGNFVSQLVVSGVQTYFHTYDGLGSTDTLTNTAATVVNNYTYYAFGEFRAISESVSNLLTWVGELGYIRDAETGEYQLHVRQYQPPNGRFKSEDPTRFEPDINLYRYANNKPATAIDPSGRISILPAAWKFDPFFGWEYGEYCGWYQRPAFCPPGSGIQAKDCTDSACEHHDCCLETTLDFLHPVTRKCCNYAFCYRLLKCAASGCNGKGPCVSHALQAAALFCAWAQSPTG